MCSASAAAKASESAAAAEAMNLLRNRVMDGEDWLVALLETIARWGDSESTVNGRLYNYFIGGEAFDWLLLAERLCLGIDGLADQDEVDSLLLAGRLPGRLDEERFRELLGGEKYRGHLNYFYGVTVEEALQVAVETEIVKRLVSNGYTDTADVSDEALSRIYRKPRDELLRGFRAETGASARRRMYVGDAKEFTYWLFKLRLKVSDKARIASDTRKGLDQLARMTASWQSRHPVAAGVGTPSG